MRSGFARAGMVMLATALAVPGTSAAPPPAGYEADLGPMPLDDETKAFIAGRGDATATIAGNRLTVRGHFRDLPSNATAAHIMLSPAIGVPGTHVLQLDLTGTTEGSVAGSYTLSRAQMQALAAGRLYVQIDSEKAPPGYSWGPRGTLWGWLLPAHARAAADVPQQGHWFIPQYEVSAR